MPLNSAALLKILSHRPGGLDDESAWERLRNTYTYRRDQKHQVTPEVLPDCEFHVARWQFGKPGAGAHIGLFIRPAAEARYPCALLLHALSRDKDEMILHFGRALAAKGVAALALDAHLHGERRSGGAQTLSPLDYLNGARDTIIEYRQAIDYLGSRSDIDASRIGLLGYSLGAMMGCILAGVDQRVRACVFLVGGDIVVTHREHVPALVRPMLDPVSPSLFVSHISPRPVLFINGKWDNKVTRASAELLHHAAREPKEILWADCGHILPEDVARQGVDWLVTRLTQ